VSFRPITNLSLVLLFLVPPVASPGAGLNSVLEEAADSPGAGLSQSRNMFDTLSKVCSSPVFHAALCVACAVIGVWGANWKVIRRVRILEDELGHLTDRFERTQKVKAGRASVEARSGHLEEAAMIAAQAKVAPVNNRLPGRAT